METTGKAAENTSKANNTTYSQPQQAQPNITTTFEKNTQFPYESPQWKNITDKLTTTVAKLMLPVSIVDDPAFLSTLSIL